MNIEYLWYSIGLILIWPQKGAKSTKIIRTTLIGALMPAHLD
jgi:hypothetical protein